jgi:putative colanic acid biosysnthesis UDP-glucose lipid carrier transferase
LSRVLRLSSPKLRYLAWALDVFIVASVGLVVYAEYHQTWDAWWVWPQIYTVMASAAALLLGFFADRLYRSWRVNDLGMMLRSVFGVWSIVMALLTLTLFLTKSSTDVSRIWFIAWGGISWIALSIQRLLAYWLLRWLRLKGHNYKTVLLVGYSAISEQVLQAIRDSAWSGLRVAGQVRVDELESYLVSLGSKQPNEVWLCLPMSDEQGIRTALNALRHSLADIRLVPDLFSLKLINHGISQALGIPMLDLSASPVTGATRLAKNIEDKLLASMILVAISPLMLGISLAIKFTSPGPVLFKQKRLGWNGKVINVYKFRSMVVHQEQSGQITQASRNDSRVTRVGAFLRRTSMDELPQFFNVLQGRMSIVGPRPHVIVHNDYYKELVPRYMLRHKVQPGITGWAQVNGFRGETDTLDKMKKRVEYDLYYIENMSIWFDLKIISMTIVKGFVNSNAY